MLHHIDVLVDVTRNRTVLVVDDELRTAQRLAVMLREDGFEVEVVRDGAAAIARLARAPAPAALVTELGIPRADGAKVARFARARQPGLPILVVTVAPNSIDVEAFGKPAPLLFTKPVDYAEFRDVLCRLVASSDHDRRESQGCGPKSGARVQSSSTEPDVR